MILCQWDREWCLAVRGRPESSGCSLRIPNWSKHADEDCGFSRQRYGSFWHKHFPSLSEITFYPCVFYHGLKIWLQAWDRGCEEPILQCLAMPGNLDELDSDYFRDLAKRINARFPGEVLIADGWERTGRAEYVKLLHIDEIEKIEGPPPKGVF